MYSDQAKQSKPKPRPAKDDDNKSVPVPELQLVSGISVQESLKSEEENGTENWRNGQSLKQGTIRSYISCRT